MNFTDAACFVARCAVIRSGSLPHRSGVRRATVESLKAASGASKSGANGRERRSGPGLHEWERLFSQIYEANYARIVAYARRHLEQDEAEEAVSNTFLVAWRRLEHVPPGAETLPWLYGVARRAASDVARSRRRRLQLVLRLTSLRVESEVDPIDVDEVEERARVVQALTRLRPCDQELLRLAEWDRLPPSEIAGALGCSINAVGIRLHRARRQLRLAIEALDADQAAQSDARLRPGPPAAACGERPTSHSAIHRY
jgi:RNA polymerase sigma factor (sigma-70 family)